MELTNKFEVPLPLALWLAVDEYKGGTNELEISATGLLKSPRYILAQLRANYPERFHPNLIQNIEPEQVELPDLQSRVAARIGTAIHSSVEHAWKNYTESGLRKLGLPMSQRDRVKINPEPDSLELDDIPVYLENRLFREIDIENIKFTISGQYDIIVNGELHDIKTTSTYSYENGCNDSKYTKQGSIYRWLNPTIITGSHLTINFLFLDWKQFMDQRNGNYPPAKAYYKQYPLMSLPDTEMYIRNKLKQVVKYWNEPLENIPCCQPEDLFSSPTTYKYYKNGYEPGKRATKNFDTFNEANRYRAENGFKGDIVEDRGKPFMCPCCIPEQVEQMSIGLHRYTKLEIG